MFFGENELKSAFSCREENLKNPGNRSTTTSEGSNFPGKCLVMLTARDFHFMVIERIAVMLRFLEN